MKILITGATGLIGRELGKKLVEKNHQLVVISRNFRGAEEVLPFPAEIIEGDLSQGPVRHQKLKEVEAVFHLAGESVAQQRWTTQQKKKIYDSRIQGSENLLNSLSPRVQTLIAASAIGYYGDRGEEELTEDSSSGGDFLAKVCVDWEKSLDAFQGRKVFLRTGVVLARQGGALAKMLFPFRAGWGGKVASGQQWMSWIHLQDLVDLYIWALENSQVEGPCNAVSPHPTRNAEFSEKFAQALRKPLALPIPQLALRALFGEFAQVVVASQKVKSEKIQKFHFSYEHLETALAEICEPFAQGEDIFEAEQFIPAPPEKVFTFFKEPRHLEQLMPAKFHFQIKTISTTDVRKGTRIDCQFKIHAFPLAWQTEILEWQPPFQFIDTQQRGPFKSWLHTHSFRAVPGGTLMTDQVRYRLPAGYLGWIFAEHFVQKDMENMFRFRRQFLALQLDL